MNPESLQPVSLAVAQERSVICGACGSTDKLCDANVDTAPADIGITTCPAVTGPNGGPDCGVITTPLQDVADCVDCVAEFSGSVPVGSHPRTSTTPWFAFSCREEAPEAQRSDARREGRRP